MARRWSPATEVAVVLSRWRTTTPSGAGSVKDALRAFGEAMDDGFLENLEEVVAENRRDYAQGDHAGAMRFLLDTTAASQMGRTRAPATVRDWLEATRDEDLAMSVMTLGELRQGIERLRPRDPDAADVFEARLDAIARHSRGG